MKKKVNVAVQAVGSMHTLFFGLRKVENYSQAARCDRGMYKKFFYHFLKHGIYTPPSLLEAHFISSAHEEADFEKTLNALEKL